MTTDTIIKCEGLIEASVAKAKEMITAASEPVALDTCAAAILKLSEAALNLEQAKTR